MATGAHTRVCAIIGLPVAHSLSPAMHNAAFAYLGLDYIYIALPVADALLAIAGAKALGFRGLNVTAPHKEAALGCCEPDAVARAVGAVNTIVFEDDHVLGSNTDVHGVDAAVRALTARPVRRALILGAGGAARAAIYALSRRGAQLSIWARRARTLELDGITHEVRAARIGQPVPAPAALVDAFAGADVVIDATPLGHSTAPVAWPLGALPSDAVVLDMNTRVETPLVRAARARGLTAATGGEMLLQQGAEGFICFTGHAAPVDVMRAALEQARSNERRIGS